MYAVTLKRNEEEIVVHAPEGTLLSDVLRQNDPSFALPCAGNHTCGKCRVAVSGMVSPPDESESRLLSDKERAEGIRLACSCRIMGPCTIQQKEGANAQILAWSALPQFTCTEHGYGLAVDIGTTTVAMQLFHRDTGEVRAEALEENAQRGFGADVISRIEACKSNGIAVLSARIAEQLERMAADCIAQAGIAKVEEAVVTGNSTMLHLYEGLDPASLAVAPFALQSNFGSMSHRTLAGAPVYLPPCIGAYVGADIVCAILASDLLGSGVQLLADIGTNGEMALAQNGKLLCCATAAGPAFEGAGLSCGMPAAVGAIRAVTMDKQRILFETVQDHPAVGICGSGILDALSVMLQKEDLEDTGYLEEDWEIADSGVTILQRDVRQIQLAKSAVCAGIMTLLETAQLTAEEVDHFAIAGGFGSSMNFHSACTIGLFPAVLQEKAEFIGNGALGGAAMLLMNRGMRDRAVQIARQATELSLSTSPSFMDHYIDCMSFQAF